MEGEEEGWFYLAGRDLPPLPPPRAEGEGWEAIDRVGAEASFLVELPMLEEVSEQHKGAWALAHSEVLQRWSDATTPEEVDRALMWLGFLPQALQRKPCGRAGKVGRAQVAWRYNCVTTGDWGGLVEAWERDLRKERDKERRMRTRQDGEDVTKLRRDVMGMFMAGKVGQGMRRVVSHGVANSQDDTVRAELQEKFLPRRHPMPASVQKTRPIESFCGLQESLLSLEPASPRAAAG